MQVITAEQAAATTVTPTPATPVTTTTEEAPAPNTIDALKAARRATATEIPKPGEAAKTDPPKPGKTTKTVDVKVPEEKLATFVKLNGELETARKKIRELEAPATEGAKVAKAMDLIKQGKHFDAIRDLVGLDNFNAAVREVVGAGDGVPKETPEAKVLREKLEALEKDNTSTKEQLAAATAAQREAGVTKIIEEVKTLADQFPYLSRSDAWVREALKGADDAYAAANAKCRDDNGRDMNDGEKNALLRAALEVAEEDRAAQAKLYAPPEAVKPKPGAKPTPRTIDRTMRGNVTAVLPKKKSATLEELKKERRARG